VDQGQVQILRCRALPLACSVLPHRHVIAWS
jgi:hypothetical protein